jgi:CheY-like chemotaxis protein
MQAKENFSILLVDDDLMVIRILNSILRDFTPLRFDRLREAIDSLDFRQALQLLSESRLKETPVSAPTWSESHS